MADKVRPWLVRALEANVISSMQHTLTPNIASFMKPPLSPNN